MTDMDLQSKLTECESIISQLVMRLQEAIDENDKLRAELARAAEGASAYDTLSDMHRNRDLPETVRLRAAIGCLPHELPKIQSVPPAMNLVAEEDEPLADKVERQRKRCYAIQALPLEQREKLVRGVGHENMATGHFNSAGNGRDDDTAS
jgi:hypothetical protein